MSHTKLLSRCRLTTGNTFMICHNQTLIVDIWSDVDSPGFVQAKCYFDQALADFSDRHRVQVNLRGTHCLGEEERKIPWAETFLLKSISNGSHEDQCGSAIPICSPHFIFNQHFYVSGVQPVQRYVNALEGMLILSNAASMEASGTQCPLGHGLV